MAFKLAFTCLSIGAILSGLWLVVCFAAWFSANVVISLGHGQFIGPSAHNKIVIANLLKAKGVFESGWVSMACKFIFCLWGSLVAYGKI